MDFFVLCSNLYCVFYVYGYLIKVEFHLLKCFILCGLMFFLFHPVLSYLIKVDVQNSHWYSCHIYCTMCGKLDCTVGGIECLYRHHGALYNTLFKTSLFDFSLASHYNLLPVDIRNVECLCFWSVDFWESVKCWCFQGVDFNCQWIVDISSSQTFSNKKNPLNRRSTLIGWIGESGLLIG